MVAEENNLNGCFRRRGNERKRGDNNYVLSKWLSDSHFDAKCTIWWQI